MQAMADAATKTITIAAPLEHCFDIVAEVERYPEWVHDIEAADVIERYDDGRPRDVEFTVSALGRNTHYTLRYDWSGAPATLRWELVEGDIMRAIDGAYRFSPPPTAVPTSPTTSPSSWSCPCPASSSGGPRRASSTRSTT